MDHVRFLVWPGSSGHVSSGSLMWASANFNLSVPYLLKVGSSIGSNKIGGV